MVSNIALAYSDVKNTLLNVPGISSTTSSFRQKLIQTAKALDINPDLLATCISFESNFSPIAKNKKSGAVGLIQWLPSTAKGLGTTVEELEGMSAEQQLDYVYKYLLPYKGRMKSLNDVYMAILNPKNIGQPANHILFPAGSKEYDQNSGFDKDKKGYITVADVSKNINSKYNSAKGERIAFDAPQEDSNVDYNSLIKELFAEGPIETLVKKAISKKILPENKFIIPTGNIKNANILSTDLRQKLGATNVSYKNSANELIIESTIYGNSRLVKEAVQQIIKDHNDR